MDDNLLREAQKLFCDDTFATQTTGISIDYLTQDCCKCSFEIKKHHLNAANNVMGGAIFTLADFTFAVAANTNAPLTVTLSSQINYVGVAKGKRLISCSRCIKSGKSVCVYEITITDELENLVAYVTTTGYKKL